MTSRRPPTSFLTLVALVFATAVLTFAVPGAAQAHSELVSSTPSDGGTTSEIPTEIVLEFNENIQEIGNEIVVVDPEGTPVADGEMVVDGPVVTQPISTGAAGEYTVTWRVVSADGHPISGEFTYELQAPTTVDETDETTEATTTDAEETTEEASTAVESGESLEDEESGSGSTVPIFIGLGVLVLAGVVILVVRRRRAR
ncbi:copper resistance CopC family protein [Pseudactinotalea sp.]|uniref:copper resistance CopC family protein n=1 Tax=Pseudactinotalea sp. TaxID=1926260 RepID=UPI003B3A94E8